MSMSGGNKKLLSPESQLTSSDYAGRQTGRKDFPEESVKLSRKGAAAGHNRLYTYGITPTLIATHNVNT